MQEREAARWALLSPLLDELLELGAEECVARLEELARRDAAAAAELSDLLARQPAVLRGGFLERPAPAIASGDTLVGRTVGTYTIERLLGEGGMGTVWLARRNDGRFEGRAAVKFLRLGLLGSAGAVRFRLEGSILARLSHPNIARLVDAGVSDGQPYLVLEHVEGQRVDEWCDARSLGVEARIRLFLAILDAVAHAHDRLVLHRDLKPSNILVTLEGQPKLIDFGVAKLLEGGAAPGRAAEVTGQAGRPYTPGYAAPEQIRGEDATTATDVYALGVILFRLLAGARSEGDSAGGGGATPRKASQVALGASPEAAARRAGATPVGLARELRGDLDNVLSMAQAEEPGRRYPTVHALADDLRAYLAHLPVAATAGSLAYRLGKAVRRHLLAFGAAAVVVLALVAGVAGTTWQAVEAGRQRAQAVAERERADREAERARKERDFALRQASRAQAVADLDDFLLYEAAPNGKPLTALELLERAERTVSRQAPADPNRVALLLAVGRQYQFLEKEGQARQLLGEAYTLARNVDDPSLGARSACALASVLGRSGDGARAEALMREGLAELPDEPQFALDRIECLRAGANVASDVGNAAEAVERASAAAALLGQLSFPPGFVATRTAMDVAEAFRWAGRLPEADSAFRRAAEEIATLGREDTETAGTLYNNWGITLLQLGRPLQAEPLLRRAMAISQAAGGEERVSPSLLANLARALVDLDRVPEAMRLLARSLELARRQHQEVAVNQGLLMVARVRLKVGDVRGAERALAEVAPRLERMLPAGHHAFAGLEAIRARAAQARGELTVARAAADRAVALGEASGQGPWLLLSLLLTRADVELAAGQWAEAAVEAGRALEQGRALAGTDQPSLPVGLAFMAQGRALRALGDEGGAERSFLSAADQLRGSVGVDNTMTRTAERLAGPGGGR